MIIIRLRVNREREVEVRRGRCEGTSVGFVRLSRMIDWGSVIGRAL